jgi:hypothetical protein
MKHALKIFKRRLQFAGHAGVAALTVHPDFPRATTIPDKGQKPMARGYVPLAERWQPALSRVWFSATA